MGCLSANKVPPPKSQRTDSKTPSTKPLDNKFSSIVPPPKIVQPAKTQRPKPPDPIKALPPDIIPSPIKQLDPIKQPIDSPKLPAIKIQQPRITDSSPIAFPMNNIAVTQPPKFEAPEDNSVPNLNLEPLYIPPGYNPFGENRGNVENYDGWTRIVSKEDYSEKNYQPFRIPPISVEIK